MSLVYRHVGCSTPVLRSRQPGGALIGSRARSEDWEVTDGKGGWMPARGGMLFPRCPDCGRQVPPSPRHIARVEETLRA
jgi:hypothetical protein